MGVVEVGIGVAEVGILVAGVVDGDSEGGSVCVSG